MIQMFRCKFERQAGRKMAKTGNAMGFELRAAVTMCGVKDTDKGFNAR